MTRPPDDLPCRRVVEIITEYLDGALPADEAARLEAHLTDCDGCTTVLEQFRTTVAATGRLADDDVDRLDEATRGNLLTAFRAWADGRAPR